MWNISIYDCALFIGAGALCFYVYWSSTRTFDYWTKRKVAGDNPYPLIGTTGKRFLLKYNQALLHQEIYKRYSNEKLVGIFNAKVPALLVRDPDLIKNLVVKDFNHFQDRGFKVPTENQPLNKQLFLANGEEWRLLRQKLTPTFTSGKMRNMFPLIVECGEQFQRYLDDIVSKGIHPEIKETMARFTTDIIGSCAFGIKMNSMQDEDSPFRAMGRKALSSSKAAMAMRLVFSFLPSIIVRHFKPRFFSLEMENFFLNLVRSVMQSRDYKPTQRNDFMDLLIELRSKGSVKMEKADDLVMTDGLLTAQAFVFFLAGFESSSTTMSFALYELVKNPGVQERLIKEIDSVLAKQGGKVTYEMLKEMKYLRMVVDETLRKYPVNPVLNRECTNASSISGTNVPLDKGLQLLVPVYAIHHDEQYYPEPEKFIPERFTPEAIANRHQYVYLPFGEGPRICIGLRFAFLVVMVGLIAILEKYKVVANEKTPQKITFKPSSFLLSCREDINLNFLKRTV